MPSALSESFIPPFAPMGDDSMDFDHGSPATHTPFRITEDGKIRINGRNYHIDVWVDGELRNPDQLKKSKDWEKFAGIIGKILAEKGLTNPDDDYDLHGLRMNEDGVRNFNYSGTTGSHAVSHNVGPINTSRLYYDITQLLPAMRAETIVFLEEEEYRKKRAPRLKKAPNSGNDPVLSHERVKSLPQGPKAINKQVHGQIQYMDINNWAMGHAGVEPGMIHSIQIDQYNREIAANSAGSIQAKRTVDMATLISSPSTPLQDISGSSERIQIPLITTNGRHFVLVSVNRKDGVIEYFDSEGDGENVSSLSCALDSLAKEMSSRDGKQYSVNNVTQYSSHQKRGTNNCGVWGRVLPHSSC